MKKLILTTCLSVAMCASGVLAVTNIDNNVYAATAQVSASNVVNQMSTAAAGASINYVENDAQLISTSKTYTGVKLTGGTGATFNLGTIDLTKTYWDGVDFTYFASQTATAYTKDPANGFTIDENGKWDEYYTGTAAYKNFFGFVYDPTVDRYNGGSSAVPEISVLKVVLTDLTDSSNKLTVTIQKIGDSAQNSAQLGAAGTGQTAQAMRKMDGANGAILYSAMRTSIKQRGSADRPYELCYNQEYTDVQADRNPALYSPNSSNAANTIGGSWLIRKFAKTSYESTSGSANEAAWYGFNSSKVNVSVIFSTVNTVGPIQSSSVGESTNNGKSSIIVTSLGGYDLNGDVEITDEDRIITLNSANPAIADVNSVTALYAPVSYNLIEGSVFVPNSKVEVYNSTEQLLKTITFTKATENYVFEAAGDYTLKFYDAEDNLVGTKTINAASLFTGETLANNVVSANGTASYVVDEPQVGDGTLTYTGLKLTGSTGTTFDLGTVKIDDDKMYWNGLEKDSAHNNNGIYTGTDYSSIFSFVYAPHASTAATGTKLDTIDYYKLEVGSIVLTFTDEATGEYMKVWISDNRGLPGAGNVTNNIQIKAKATNNDSIWTEQRPCSAATYLQQSVYRLINVHGNQATPIDIAWDNDKASVYTNVSSTMTYDGLNGAWCVRNFGSNTFADYPKSYSPWYGFTNGANVRVSLYMDNVSSTTGATDSSIIITKFAGNDLSAEGYTENTSTLSAKDIDVISGEPYDFSNAVLKTGSISLSETVYPFAYMKVDGVTVVDGENNYVKEYTFTEAKDYTVTFFNENDTQIAACTVTSTSLTLTLGALVGGEVQISTDGGETWAVATNGMVVNKTDLIKLVPTGTVSATGEAYDTLRNLILNGVTYGTNITTFAPVNNYAANVEYSASELLNGANINISATFDILCKIYLKDENVDGGVAKVVAVRWGSDGNFAFQSVGYQAANNWQDAGLKTKTDANGKTYNEWLTGFGRSNADYTDRCIASTNNIWLSKENSAAQYLHNGTSTSMGKLYRNNYFEALYVKIYTEVQVKVTGDSATSGLRFVMKVNKADMDRVTKYSGLITSIDFRNFITAYEVLNVANCNGDANYQYDLTTIDSSDFMTSAIWGRFTTVNGEKVAYKNALGLYDASCDKYYKDATTIEDLKDDNGGLLAPGYIYMDGCLGANGATPELNLMVEGADPDYYCYAMTVTNLYTANLDYEYVFMANGVIGTGFGGGATSSCIKATKYSVKSALQEKLNSVISDTADAYYNHAITVNGDVKYTCFNLNQIQWLYGVVDSTAVVAEVEA